MEEEKEEEKGMFTTESPRERGGKKHSVDVLSFDGRDGRRQRQMLFQWLVCVSNDVRTQWGIAVVEIGRELRRRLAGKRGCGRSWGSHMNKRQETRDKRQETRDKRVSPRGFSKERETAGSVGGEEEKPPTDRVLSTSSPVWLCIPQV